jgi:hypothetical protein
METFEKAKRSKEWWKKLRHGNIVGIVSSQGEVFSVFTGENLKCHEEFWKLKGSVAWRWSFDKSLWWITSCQKPNEEQIESIQKHLTKKYGIEWFENGHFDWEHLLVKCGKSRDEDGVWS